MTVVRVASFGCTVSRADYYGWRFGLHIGVWLIFFGRLDV